GFFFQAEDGIRDYKVTGVQTCALPIWAQPPDLLGLGLLDLQDQLGAREDGVGVRHDRRALGAELLVAHRAALARALLDQDLVAEIGRASCRERALNWGVSAT